jgi:TRAP-type C4-dicarboxylate transport system permease small subunit
MLIGNAIEVIARYFFSRSTGIMDELMIYCNIGLIFLALGWGWRTKAHIYIEIILDRLHGRWYTTIYLGGLLLSLVTLIGLLVSAILYEESVIKSGLRAYTALGMSRWIPNIAICLGLFILFLELLLTIIKQIMAAFGSRSEAI